MLYGAQPPTCDATRLDVSTIKLYYDAASYHPIKYHYVLIVYMTRISVSNSYKTVLIIIINIVVIKMYPRVHHRVYITLIAIAVSRINYGVYGARCSIIRFMDRIMRQRRVYKNKYKLYIDD